MRIVLVLAALITGCTAASAPATAAAPDACAKDTDCKGSRLCVAGACADSPDLAAPFDDHAPDLAETTPPGRGSS